MAYRDPLPALTARERELKRELEVLTAQLSEHDSRVARSTQVRRELDSLAPRLTEARARHALPMLSRVRVASPCKESWEGMAGDEHVRHCGRCDKNVYNLSALTREQAETLLQEREGELCVRFFRRSDGTIMTADCAPGRRRRRLRHLALAAAMTAGVAGVGEAVYYYAMEEPCQVVGTMPMEMVQGGVEPEVHADLSEPTSAHEGDVLPVPERGHE